MDRAAYDRYQARFFDVFKKFSGQLLPAQAIVLLAKGICAGGLMAVSRYHHQGPIPNPKPNGNGAGA
jgi:hypothetical protein